MEENFSLGQEFDGNPFESLMQRGSSGAQSQSPQIPPQMMGQMPGMEENQLLKGKGQGGSKYLLSAIQALQGYVAESQDRDEIEVARSIVKLLIRLVHQDQEKLEEKLNQDSQMAQSMQGQSQEY